MTEISIPKAPVVPYLTLRDGNAAITFYQRAFGARSKVRLRRTHMCAPCLAPQGAGVATLLREGKRHVRRK